MSQNVRLPRFGFTLFEYAMPTGGDFKREAVGFTGSVIGLNPLVHCPCSNRRAKYALAFSM